MRAETRPRSGQRVALLAVPLGLALDAHAFGDPVDVVEERDDLNGVVDGGVVPAVAAKEIGILTADLRGRRGELDGVVAERADAWLEIGLPVVVLRVLGQLLGCALCTEVVCVRV